MVPSVGHTSLGRRCRWGEWRGFLPDATRNGLGSSGWMGFLMVTRIAAAVPGWDGRRRIGVVKRSAVRTGRLRRSPVVHSRPIDLVVFQEPSSINRLETSS